MGLNNRHTRYTNPSVGSFEADSFRARVLIILHELAHVILKEGAREGGTQDENFLIGNDTGDTEAAKKNDELIEKKCRDQINALNEEEFESE